MTDLTIIPHEVDEISTDDHLDSRYIQERIDYLEYIIANNPDEMADKVVEEWQEEIVKLDELKEQYVNDYGESSWEFGAQFHRVDDFENYARELADDIGAISDEVANGWPTRHIDWAAAADDLANDYSEVTFDGVDYYTQEA